MTTTTTDPIVEILEAAVRQFRLRNPELRRGVRNPYHIEVPARLCRGRIPFTDWLSDPSIRAPSIEPAAYLVPELAGAEPPPYSGQTEAELPCIAFVVGDAGLGKTEFVYAFCQRLIELRSGAPGGRAPAPLPVNLAEHRFAFRDRFDLKTVLFGGLVAECDAQRDTPLADSFIDDMLLPAIRRGDIVLVLDGLDEVFVYSGQAKQFYIQLAGLLRSRDDEPPPQFLVILAARMEFFALCRTEAAHRELYAAHAGVTIDFLRLRFFTHDEVEDYVHRRLRDSAPAVMGRIEARSDIRVSLGRPLLLDIFCRLDQQALNRFLEKPTERILLDEFILGVSDYRHDLDGNRHLRFLWNRDALGAASLHAFREGGNRFSIEQLEPLLHVIEDGRRIPAHQMEKADLRAGIHKCPFLALDLSKPDSKQRYGFSHQLFFDYFIVHGMYCELKQRQEGFSAFDAVVLTINMRRMLKEEADESGPDYWRARTKHSYGLTKEHEGSWPDGAKNWRELEDIRYTLLESMCIADVATQDIAKVDAAVKRFLGLDEEIWLHPAYRMYNYQAVSDWLMRTSLRPDAVEENAQLELRKRFSELLCQSLHETWRDIGKAPASDLARRHQGPLLERIVAIAKLMGLHWLGEELENMNDEDGALSRVKDYFIRSRLLDLARDGRPDLQWVSEP